MTIESSAGHGAGLAGIARRLAALTGWRRHSAAALCGALATAGLPPLYLVPLVIPAFTGLLWLLDGARRPREAALIGWSFGFGHMASGLYWIGIAFLVDADRFGFIMPFAVAGMAAGMAIFPALVTFALGCLGWRGPARVALLATFWLLSEWLRGWVLTGLPWNLIGSVWSFSPATLQLAAVTGIWGLSLMTVLAAAAPAVLAEGGAEGDIAAPRPERGRPARGRRVFVAAMLLLPLAAWGAGTIRLAAAPPLGANVVEGVRLRLVQPSIEQSLKWRADQRRNNVDRQIELSLAPPRDPDAEPITHIIWAETAVPYLLSEEPELRRLVARVVPPDGLLLTGAPRSGAEAGIGRLWNSLHALNAKGEIIGTYDKHHLVPFGEYTPLRSLLGLVKLTAGDVDFSPGPGPVTLDLPGLPPVSPLICYEAIFPGQVVASGPRPEWLLNMTNDSWFGTSSGPFQHFASARTRAVEEGLPLIRVANAGVSVVIDGYGRIVGQLRLNQTGFLDASLPRPAAGGTLYASVGNLAIFILCMAMLIYILILRRFMS